MTPLLSPVQAANDPSPVSRVVTQPPGRLGSSRPNSLMRHGTRWCGRHPALPPPRGRQPGAGATCGEQTVCVLAGQRSSIPPVPEARAKSGAAKRPVGHRVDVSARPAAGEFQIDACAVMALLGRQASPLPSQYSDERQAAARSAGHRHARPVLCDAVDLLRCRRAACRAMMSRAAHLVQRPLTLELDHQAAADVPVQSSRSASSSWLNVADKRSITTWPGQFTLFHEMPGTPHHRRAYGPTLTAPSTSTAGEWECHDGCASTSVDASFVGS